MTIQGLKFEIRNELVDQYTNGEINTIINALFEKHLYLQPFKIVQKQDQKIDAKTYSSFKKDVHQIKAGKPYQYVIGFTWFYDLKIEVNESVLIPRPETEELVHWIIQNNSNKQNLDIIDIGTGSGCIALTLKSKIKNALVTGVDISEEAIAVAQKNAELNQLQVHFELFDVLQYLPNKQQAFFDVVVSNPPYIPENEQVQMDQIVTDHEPAIALFTPKDQPLLFYEHICRYARQYLKPGGFLYFEMHENYGTEVEQTMNRFGFEEVTLKKDMQNKLRMIRGRH